MSERLPTLDGLRGMLALIVVADHAVELCAGSYALAGVATECVAVFFAMSAMVLARSYDGRYGRFLARRAVRLLPVYLLCWAAGCAVYGRFDLPQHVDPPAWSMNLEGAAMLLFPVIVWCAARPWAAALATATAFVIGAEWWWFGFHSAFFVLGAVCASASPRVVWLETAAPQWLGKVSYSLYLTHWLVIKALGVWGLPLVLPVAWAVWWAVERPSVAMSRCYLGVK